MKYQGLKIGALEAEVPIVQGGMGIGISLGGLAGAVASEGAVGIISAAQIGYRYPAFEKNPLEANLRAIHEEFQKAKEIAGNRGIIGFNIMVAMKYYSEYVLEAAKAGAELIISGAGLPTELPALVKGFPTKIAPIVSTEKSAKVILKYWDRKYKRTADMVVIEGPKAGGHLGFSMEQLEAYNKSSREVLIEEPTADSREVLIENSIDYVDEIQKIIAVTKIYEEKYHCKIPVVVAGGISTKEEMERLMSLGIQGVQIGSRFVTTEECDASEAYKLSYVHATREDVKLVKSPVGMQGRAIRNAFMERVERGETMTPKKCLHCLNSCKPSEIPYCITEALIRGVKGDVENGLIFCGSEAYSATKIETVKDVVDYFMEK